MAKLEKEQIRVLACGSRKYENRDMINKVLDALYVKYGKQMCLIVGGAVGADELARQWAVSRKCDHIVYYARWETEGKGAGPKRNQRMAKLKPRRVVAFLVNQPGENRGTNNMIQLAVDAGIRVKKFY